METTRALAIFSALGQQTRLEGFRLLAAAGPRGLTVGEIAAALGARDNTMSVALGVLSQAGLVRSRREGRSNRYLAEMGAVREVIDFLTEECCGGSPEHCLPVASGDAWKEALDMSQARNVLFLCSGNSARSLMAEAILNREARGRFRAYSAGSHPRPGPHPFTLDLLRRLNHDVSAIRSKDWAEFATSEAPEMDFVFTVCDTAAGEVCPVWPGQPITAHWGVPDPVAAQGNEAERRLAFSDAYRMLQNRISIFLSLPVDSIDRLALQHRLDEIGRVGSGATAQG